MKHVLLAMFVLLGTQPLPALGCDLHADQSPVAAEHQHMAGHATGDVAGMDCCDDDAAEQPEHCALMSQCGTCTPGLSAVFAFLPHAAPGSTSLLLMLDSDAMPDPFYAPPFRPPIS